jgi:RCC1 and BTB domain-containing protein
MNIEFGQLYTFGYNSRGQLGQSTTMQFHQPSLVRGLERKIVLQVACSYYHTLVATREQEVYGFGRNDFGQIGSDDLADKLAPFRIKYFDGLSVYFIACGQYHSVVSLGICMIYCTVSL